MSNISEEKMKILEQIKALKEKEQELTSIEDNELSPKDRAIKNHEPWVDIIKIELDPENILNGIFELDWNEVFIAKLVKSGFNGKTEADIVDQWFKRICALVAQEIYEQDQADPDNRVPK